MSTLTRHSRLIAVALVSVALGAGASAIASAGASPRHAARHRAAGAFSRASGHGLRGLRLRRLIARTVHADLVIATKHGFVNVSVDRGKIASLNGRELTISEGRGTLTRSVTLDIPATARVRNGRQVSALSSLRSGERVIVITTPKRTVVLAH